MYTLYYAPGTIALAAHIALQQAQADYKTILVDFSAEEQKTAEYLAINPKGRVPALITEQGLLTETPAILLFICQTHPKAGLAPLDNPFLLAQVQSFNTYLCSTVHVAHAHRVRGHRWADDAAAWAAMKRKVPQTMAACFTLIEKEMLPGPWVFGETYSIADMYLFTIARWLEGDGVDPKQFPKVFAHRTRMAEQPAIRKVLESQNLQP